MKNALWVLAILQPHFQDSTFSIESMKQQVKADLQQQLADEKPHFRNVDVESSRLVTAEELPQACRGHLLHWRQTEPCALQFKKSVVDELVLCRCQGSGPHAAHISAQVKTESIAGRVYCVAEPMPRAWRYAHK